MLLDAQPDLSVIGVACGGNEALELAVTLRPDIVVMDAGTYLGNGIAATRSLHAACPEAPIVVLSLHEDGPVRERAELAGASAVVPKCMPSEILLSTIREVAPTRTGEQPQRSAPSRCPPESRGASA
jgi:two-component system invasion response regulator UvrY